MSPTRRSARRAIERIAETSGRYSNLEYRLDERRRLLGEPGGCDEVVRAQQDRTEREGAHRDADADVVGADGYAADASTAVRRAKELIAVKRGS
mgnify:CR=1 FL=1